MRVLHLPTAVGGNSWGLAQAEKKIGLDSTVLIDSNNWLNYKSDICLNLESKNYVYSLYKRLNFFLRIRKKYDVYHFNFGTSLIDTKFFGLYLLDLPFYRGKKIMTYNGGDARQNLNRIKDKFIDKVYEITTYRNERRNKAIRKRIIKVSKYVDHIFSVNPDLMNFLPKDKTTFLPYTIAKWSEIKYIPYKLNEKIRIVHAPTSREIKGSSYILKALDKLQKKYPIVEVCIIENIAYDEAIERYKYADLVIDQVLIGWYGALAVEVMKMGKPLAVYIRKEDLCFVPKQMAEDVLDTVININSSNVENVLEQYILNKNRLYEKSKKSVEYAHKWHDPVKIAKEVQKVYLA
ncbi:hypothetical protein [Francisella sp. 19X1-34]|uniref:hypothetical protein n=1 Tax=Francisella sp. 19X1-34 TaxID=3087177 RepID=UPI002E2FAFBC|nr:hypothetical protein [Francisella sp. 19X1-34]MED7787545.1 hypothetical protein [Francisella sp. 19X1-34]